MQMSAEGTARLSHVSDDLASLYRLARTDPIEDMWDDMVVMPSACLRATWLPAQSPELPEKRTTPDLTARIGVPYAARKSRPVWYLDHIPYWPK